MRNPFAKRLSFADRIERLPKTEVIDVRAYSITRSYGYAYIGTESSEGSSELIFQSSPELCERARPYIENGELYGFMLPIADVKSAD